MTGRHRKKSFPCAMNPLTNALPPAHAQTLGTIFGNSVENTSIGITGDCTVVDIDGPFVTVRLSGRFWHKRAGKLCALSLIGHYLPDPNPNPNHSTRRFSSR